MASAASAASSSSSRSRECRPTGARRYREQNHHGGECDPRLSRVFTQFRLNSPQVQLNIDRNKAKALGISMTDLFETIGTDLGSTT